MTQDKLSPKYSGRFIEAENARLKRMYADERLKSDILQDALLKKF